MLPPTPRTPFPNGTMVGGTSSQGPLPPNPKPRLRRFLSQQSPAPHHSETLAMPHPLSHSDLGPLLEECEKGGKFERFEPVSGGSGVVDWNEYQLFREQMKRRRSTGSHVMRRLNRLKIKRLR